MTLHTYYNHQFRLITSPAEDCKYTEFEIKGMPETRTRCLNNIIIPYKDDMNSKQEVIIYRVNNNFKSSISCLIKRASFFNNDQHGLSSIERKIINNFISSSTHDKCIIPNCKNTACLSHNIGQSIIMKWAPSDENIWNINNPFYKPIKYDKGLFQDKRISFMPHKHNSGVKRAFCKDHEKIFNNMDTTATDNINNFRLDAHKIKNNTTMLNILFYKTLVFQYIYCYDYLWQILWDTLLILYAEKKLYKHI